MSVQVARRYFSVDEFHRMGAAGIFSEDDRVELIEGEILQMSPIGSSRSVCEAPQCRNHDPAWVKRNC